VRPWPRLFEARPLEVLGVGSLLVYFVHVELVYGWVSAPLKRRLTIEEGVVAWALLSAAMYVMVVAWNRWRPRKHKFS
jgi:hypothetical protein